jgi:hypothetical protein
MTKTFFRSAKNFLDSEIRAIRASLALFDCGIRATGKRSTTYSEGRPDLKFS